MYSFWAVLQHKLRFSLGKLLVNKTSEQNYSIENTAVAVGSLTGQVFKLQHLFTLSSTEQSQSNGGFMKNNKVI